MTKTEVISAAEAVLFACGDPVEDRRLAASAGFDEEETDEVIRLLNIRYADSGSALCVMKLGDCHQLCVREEFSEYARAALENKKNIPLSPAAMEVLTIVAYNQPVSKSFVEHVRGIESSNIVNSLVEKNLLEEAGRLDVPGKPLSYRTTPAFLRCFGLSSLDDLPELPKSASAEAEDLLEADGDGGETDRSGGS